MSYTGKQLTGPATYDTVSRMQQDPDEETAFQERRPREGQGRCLGCAQSGQREARELPCSLQERRGDDSKTRKTM